MIQALFRFLEVAAVCATILGVVALLILRFKGPDDE